MKNVLLTFGIGLLLVACGDGTVGPLETGGLSARKTLRNDVDWIRQHGSADTRPLDALIDLQTYIQLVDSTNVMFYRVEAQVIDERGKILNPSISMHNMPMSLVGSGLVRLQTVISDTNLVFTIVWPDTTIAIPVSILSATSIGADTLTYKTTWSRSAPSPILTKGHASDSIVIAVSRIEGIGRWSSTVWDTLEDRGSFTLPARFADSAQVGDQFIVQQYRSYYQVIRLTTPNSGYGDRYVGILQSHRVPYLITVAP